MSDEGPFEAAMRRAAQKRQANKPATTTTVTTEQVTKTEDSPKTGATTMASKNTATKSSPESNKALASKLSTDDAGNVSSNGVPIGRVDDNGIKKTSNYRADGGLTPSHVRILTLLSKSKTPLTADSIAEKLSAPHPKTIRWSLGSIKADNRDPLSLLARKAVKQTEIGGKDDSPKDHVYEITAAGKQQLDKHLKAAAAKAK